MNLVKIVRSGLPSTSESTFGKMAGSHSTAHGPGGKNIICMSTQMWTARVEIGVIAITTSLP